MTRLLQKPNVMQAEIELRINQAYDKLKEKSDEELNSKLIEGFRYSERKDANSDKIDNWNILFASYIFYDGIASQRILVERYNIEYCQRLLGY